jgi:hypothetical protein
MSCILRVVGTDLDVDALAKSVPIVPYRIDRKGERWRPQSKVNFELSKRSGLHFDVGGSSDSDLAQQVAAAIGFLSTYFDPISIMMTSPGVDGGSLDFKVDVEEYAMQCDYLPPELLRLAGSLNLGIEVSHYFVLRDDGEPSLDNES